MSQTDVTNGSRRTGVLRRSCDVTSIPTFFSKTMASPSISKAFRSPLKYLRTDLKRWPHQRHVRVITTRINTLKPVHPHFFRKCRNAAFCFNIPRQYTRTFTSQTTDIVFPDPARPDLFYHFVYPPTPLSHTTPAFALSFLETTPPSVDSPTIIGWLPAQTYSTDSPDNEGSKSKGTSSTLQDFVVNGEFVFILRLLK